ncbi:MAG: hypothetical protein JXB49_31085 [Bacteroidales bacterium]|nr:hypothetical protein [Bacteroidales bacterium]MBN2820715.1 hypothetical protein [Bacteroidales bacterium]
MFKQNYILFSLAMLLIPLFSNRGGILGLTAGGIIILIYFILFKKDIVLAFALCAVIDSNPAMLLEYFAFGFPTALPFGTIFYFFSFLVMFSPQVKERKVDYNLKRFLPVLYLFTLYQFFISFLLKVSPDNILEIFHSIYRGFPTYLGVYLVIPSYVIFKIDGKKFINAIVLSVIFITLIILINLYTPLEIFKVRAYWRNGATRIILFQSYLFYISTFVAIGFFVFFGGKKAHIHYYMAGVMTMMLPFIAMYRLELVTEVLTILLVVFLVSKYLNRNLTGFVKLIKVLVLMIAVVFIMAPTVYNGMKDLYIATFEELFGIGGVEEGTTQTRTEHELPLHLSMIRANPILGNGYDSRWWGNNETDMDWGLSDIPLTGTLAMYGWLGWLIYHSRFLFFLPLSKHVLKAIGKDRAKMEQNGFLYIVIIALRAYFIAMITFRFFYIGYELTFTKVFADFGTMLGIYFAAIYMVENQNNRQDSSSVLGSFKEIKQVHS